MRSVGGDMNVLLVRYGSVERHEIDDLPRLLKDQDAVIWVDIPVCDELAAEVLSEFRLDRARRARVRSNANHVSKLHVYDDHVFTVLHAPHLGQGGTCALCGARPVSLAGTSLSTVHRPLNPAVKPEGPLWTLIDVLDRIENHTPGWNPRSSFRIGLSPR